MNKFLTFFTALVLCCGFLCPAAAQESRDVVVSLQINNPLMEVNGSETEIDTGRGTVPVVTAGRTLVPVRAIIEAFGGNVYWDQSTETARLILDENTVELVIGSKTAYLNGKENSLDAAPVIINDRTMLPIRFVAEGLGLGVAWEEEKETVSIIRNGLDADEYEYLTENVPEYEGKPFVQINNNIPMFREYEIIGGSFEYYSRLDTLKRCDVCMASVAEDIMPEGERGNISSVTPTGWINNRYDVVDGGYLYNRCHLIGYQLTGENANSRNLITGTRYLNVQGMLPFENAVDDYIEETGNHVMYRVTPLFEGNNLVASGVLMEAYSVEDEGRGISFCVFCYNVQPYIFIDYLTGANSLKGEMSAAQSKQKIYRTPTGSKYHYDLGCGGKNSYETTFEEALKDGLKPCSKCVE